MGIKLKNTKEKSSKEDKKHTNNTEDLYDNIVKDFKRIKRNRTLVMLLLIMAVSFTFLGYKDVNNNKHIFNKANMYNYDFLGDEIEGFTSDVITFGELYKSEEYVKNKENITQRELNIARDWVNRSIQGAYDEKVAKLDEIDTSSWTEERWNKEYEKIRNEVEDKYNYDDEKLKDLIVNQKLINYKKYKNILDNQYNLKYILYDKTNNMWLSNYEANKEAVSKLKTQSGYFAEYHISMGNSQSAIYIDGKRLTEKDIDKYRLFNRYIYSGYDNSEINIETQLLINYENVPYTLDLNNDFDIYISVPYNLKYGDNVYSSMENFEKAKSMIALQILVLILGVITTVALTLYLKKKKYKGNYFDDVIKRLKEIPIEFTIIGLIIIYILKAGLFIYGYIGEYIYTININNIIVWTITLLSTYIVIKVIYLKYKENILFKDSYLLQFYDNITICLEKKSFGKKLFWILTIYVLGLGFGGLVLILALDGIGLIIAVFGFVVATVIAIFTSVRDFAYLNKITKGAKDICDGTTNKDIPEHGKGALRDLAHSINNMKEGLRKSIENETKSEKMKTELITNVSHDLKTPLTSIINYVDLLKRCNIESEEAKAYIDILDKKSQRLKILIDDLFEASKAASGSMKLTFTKVDVVALLKQTLGEAEGRIEKANLDFKLSVSNKKVYINADGGKIWRVFENLISNIIKYSLPGTRVYINVKEDDGKVYIIMKNISSYELNFDTDEITERFRRGDESRHTEGSGLGLAIAKNIVNLHGGEFFIEVDGDLFKSTVIFSVDSSEPN